MHGLSFRWRRSMLMLGAILSAFTPAELSADLADGRPRVSKRASELSSTFRRARNLPQRFKRSKKGHRSRNGRESDLGMGQECIWSWPSGGRLSGRRQSRVDSRFRARAHQPAGQESSTRHALHQRHILFSRASVIFLVPRRIRACPRTSGSWSYVLVD